MEITLTRQRGTQVQVTCDGQPSHSFNLQSLVLAEEGQPGLPPRLKDPVAYGKAAYQALFPAGSPAQRALEAAPERILLVTTDDTIDAVPWEYAYGPTGFLVLKCHFVRGLPSDKRIAPPSLDSGLHIVAIPSNPLDKRLNPLNIEGEWTRLQEIIRKVSNAVTLERAYPPTIEQVRSLVANQRHRVVHFMGHGGQDEQAGAFLCLEKENGTLDPVTAEQFLLRVRRNVFLVTLNACVSATPGPTPFSNLASALAQQKVPYALGMRVSIHDDDARNFSRSFYSELASGVPVEEALFQARLTLANSPRKLAIGVPVLYTSLSAPAGGYAAIAGAPTIVEHKPPIDAIALPRAEGGFQGRIDELVWLGEKLTGDERSPVITIHGTGGQGKTALAREAVERFAFAWPGGIWATSFVNLPSLEVFITNLARFLGITVQEGTAQEELERQVLLRLSQGQPRTLIVLDNVETLIEAVNKKDIAATNLAQFIREHLTRPPVSLLITSRSFLGWQGEIDFDLGGLLADEGAKLFQQSAPQRSNEIELAEAAELSRKIAGHPLSLRLLGGAFNQIKLSLSEFMRDCETYLLAAEDKYVGVAHRQRTLYACIETSVRYLDADLSQLFSGLWVFHAPFLPDRAVAIFDPDFDNSKDEHSPVYDQLYALWLRGLLTLERETLREGTFEYYSLLPTMRPYIEKYLARPEEREQLLARFGAAYARLARFLHYELDRGGMAAFIAEQSREDLERGASYVTGVAQGYYLLDWGWVLQRTGYTRRSKELTEQALEIGQGHERSLELHALNNMAMVYQATGQPKRALELYEQALPLRREVGDRAGEAATLNNMAAVYDATGQLERELELYKQVLPIRREVGDRAGEAATLNGLALLLKDMHQYEDAQAAFVESILLERQVNHPAGEVAGLVGLAFLLYQHLNRQQDAIDAMQQAIGVMDETGLPQDAARNTREDLQQYLDAMRQGIALGEANQTATMPTDQLQVIVHNTVTVMTTVHESRAEWYKTIRSALQDAQQRGADWQIEVDFFTAVLALLDGQSPSLSDEQPYAAALAQIQAGIAAGGVQDDADSEDDELPFDAELIPRSIAALLSTPQEKMAHLQFLAAMGAQASDEQLKALMQTIQMALLGGDLAQVGQDLEGVYLQAWRSIVIGVETGGVDPRLFEMIGSNTLAVLGPAPEELPEWRAMVLQLKEQAIEANNQQLVALLDAVVGLLDAGGDPGGLGVGLTGYYAQVWQALIGSLGK